MADDNLAIIKVGQQAAQNFFNTFNKNQTDVFNAQMAADKAKLDAINTANNFALNKVNTESMMRAREANVKLAFEANDRQNEQHKFLYGPEAIQNRRQLAELQIKNAEFAYKKNVEAAKTAEIDKHFNAALSPIATDLFDTYVNTYNRGFSRDAEKLFADVRGEILSGEIDAQEGAEKIKRKYQELKDATDFTIKDDWTQADYLEMKKKNPEQAERLNFQLNPEFADERNGVAANFVTADNSPSANAAFNKFNDGNPNAKNLGRYRRATIKTNNRIDAVNQRIEILGSLIKDAPDPAVKQKMLSEMTPLYDEAFKLQEEIDGINSAVSQGIDFDDYKALPEKEFQEGKAQIPTPDLDPKLKEIADRSTGEGRLIGGGDLAAQLRVDDSKYGKLQGRFFEKLPGAAGGMGIYNGSKFQEFFPDLKDINIEEWHLNRSPLFDGPGGYKNLKPEGIRELEGFVDKGIDAMFEQDKKDGSSNLILEFIDYNNDKYGFKQVFNFEKSRDPKNPSRVLDIRSINNLGTRYNKPQYIPSGSRGVDLSRGVARTIKDYSTADIIKALKKAALLELMEGTQL